MLLFREPVSRPGSVKNDVSVCLFLKNEKKNIEITLVYYDIWQKKMYNIRVMCFAYFCEGEDHTFISSEMYDLTHIWNLDVLLLS